MKKLLKVFLPPFAGFLMYFLMVRYSSYYFDLRIDQMGRGDLLSFMAFYRYMLPLLFTVAVLTQLLVVNPIWRSVIDRPTKTKVIYTISLLFVCLVFAAGISYCIWDKQDGIHHLLMQFVFMSAVQSFYWVINLSILKFLSS